MVSDKSRFIPRICYEIFVRSFCDSNGDGIGDLRGIISKLDYLSDLGIEAIWLTPIHPSPTYHKYDVIDYYNVDPEFGTLDDFRELIAKAHERRIEIYLDLIVNHTSTLHPWFIEARKSSQNTHREFYWWMTPPQIEELGISKRETSDDSQVVYPWHDNTDDQEKYYGLFYKGMPDLNYHSEQLRVEIEKIVRFWLVDMQVDGFRIDAARHIFPEWEKENSIEFWHFFSNIINQVKPEAFTVAEVWAETEEVAPYFRNLDATFHFDLSFALQRMLIQEKDEDLISKLRASYDLYEKYNPLFVDAIMLTNHDQERIGSVVGNHSQKIKLAASILLTLPGQPYIYYGEELGMLGAKPDPYIREPFLWSKNEGSCNTKWIEAQFTTLETVTPLSEQQADDRSIYHHYKSLINLRKNEPAIGQIFAPNLIKIDLLDNQLLAYFRPHAERSLVIIHNLSGDRKDFVLPNDKSDFRSIVFSTNAATEISSLQPYSSIVLSAAPRN